MKEDTSVFAFDHAKFSTVGSHKQSAVKRNVSKSYSLQNEFQFGCNYNVTSYFLDVLLGWNVMKRNDVSKIENCFVPL